MTRKERKARAEKRRQKIQAQIANIVSDSFASGKSFQESILEAEWWIQAEVAGRPQEAAMYVSAAKRYARLLRSSIDSAKGGVK